MKVVYTITARESSRRLPGKALEPLDEDGEWPILWFLLKRVEEHFSSYARIWVCTDENSPDIVDMALDGGYGLIEGDSLDCASRLLQAAEEAEADTIVRLTGDNPYVDLDVTEALLALHESTGADYTCAPYLPAGTKAEIIDFVALDLEWDSMTKAERDNTEYLSNFLRQWDRKVIINHPPMPGRFTIDTPKDLARARKIYKDFDGQVPGVRGLVEWWSANEK